MKRRGTSGERASLPSIPSHWRWVPLAEVAEVRLGKMLSRKAFDAELVQLPYLRNQNVQWLSVDLDDLKTMGFRKSELERYRVLPGDLLVCEGGEPGRAAVYKGGVKDLMYQKALHRIRPRDGAASAAFLQYFFARHAHGSAVLPRRSETTIKHLPLEKIKRVPVSLPPIEEQHGIVNRIEELFSDLDAGVAALERAKANLARYRAAVLKAAVEGRLTEQWRREHPDVEPASELLKRILAKRRRQWEEEQLAKYAANGKRPSKGWRGSYREPAAPDPSGLHGLPRSWVWTTIDALGDVVSGVTKGQRPKSKDNRVEVPYLRVANVQSGLLDLTVVKRILASASEIERYRLRAGDVLFTEGGDRDKLGRGWVWNGEIDTCIHQNHIFRLRLFSEECVPELISVHGNMFGRRWFQTAGRQTVNLASINQRILRNFPVPLAPRSEQVVMRERIQEVTSGANYLDRQLDRSRMAASRLRRSVLSYAFAGTLVT